MVKKKLLIIANWKMYVATPLEVRKTLQSLRKQSLALRGVEVVVAPSFVLLSAVVDALKGSKIGVAAQSVSPSADGAHTGDVSALMLKAVSAKSVIIGHSERRASGETDAMIREEIAQTLSVGLRVVLCVGEKERDHDHGSHFAFIASQLRSALADLAKSDAHRLVIAYEPVWAIGKSANSAMAPAALRETSIFIKKILVEHFGREAGISIPILYGGSVDETNAGALVSGGEVDGLLVGRASVKAPSFVALIQACKTTINARSKK